MATNRRLGIKASPSCEQPDAGEEGNRPPVGHTRHDEVVTTDDGLNGRAMLHALLNNPRRNAAHTDLVATIPNRYGPPITIGKQSV